jgi:hypothetical protein
MAKLDDPKAYLWQMVYQAPDKQPCLLRPKELICFKKSGAAYVTRTRDPIITNDVLYRLS